MINLDPDRVRHFVADAAHDKLADVKVFAEIDSTNTYLMQMPGPKPGMMNIAATSNQTAGRGRHGKTWTSPPGSGLCLSTAYTFAQQPENLPALTLALGLGAAEALEELGASGVELKWPNDVVAQDGKLGGILTEVQRRSARGVTVVTGIGINVNLPLDMNIGFESDWSRQVVDLKRICPQIPEREEIAGVMTSHLLKAFEDFERSGFATVAERWSKRDWLRGRELTVDMSADEIFGIGAGVAEDGALLIDTREQGIQRVTSGTVISVGRRGRR